MRRAILVVLTLAGCAVHDGRYPTYQVGEATGWDRYRTAREAALLTGAPTPQTVPVALPAAAPTPAEIAGPTLMDIVAQRWRVANGQGRHVPPAPVRPDPLARPSLTAAPNASPAVRMVAARDRAVIAVPVPAQAAAAPAPAAAAPQAGSPPVLAQYAAAATHAPGTPVWPRRGGLAETAARACAAWQTADRAQTAFLAAGGPAADPAGMDPDGDGFVCGWTPAAWRL